MRLIDADILLEQNARIVADGGMDATEKIGRIIIAITDAPTVDAAPVVHGRWLRLDTHKGIEQFKCSICRSECYVPTCMNEPMYDFCPNCGAKMDGGENDDR